MTPFRRWLIRSFFLTLLLLWAAGWAVSTRYIARGEYYHGGKELVGGVSSGVVFFSWGRDPTTATDKWRGGLAPHPFRLVDSDFWWYRDSSDDDDLTYSYVHVVGFSYAHYSRSQAPHPPYVLHGVGVPFWFLLLVSGAALRWAWRKTRPQPSAFPVETSKGNP